MGTVLHDRPDYVARARSGLFSPRRRTRSSATANYRKRL